MARIKAEQEAATAAARAIAEAEALLLEQPEFATVIAVLFPTSINAVLCWNWPAAPKSKCEPSAGAVHADVYNASRAAF